MTTKSTSDCDRFAGRRRDICRGHDDDGNPVDLSPEKRAVYLARWSAAPPADKAKAKDRAALPCRHRGDVLRRADCRVCPRETVLLPVFACALHGECVLRRGTEGVRPCSKCRDRAPEPTPRPAALAPDFAPGPKVGGFLWAAATGASADCLRDQYKGATCFLLCGGPSLAAVDRARLERRGVLVAAVNNAAVASARPHLAFMVDAPGKFHPAVWLDPGIKKFIRRNQDGKPIRLPDGRGGWRESRLRVADCPEVYVYREGSGFDAETFLTRATPSWECAWEANGKRHVKRSVFLVALRMLYWLGVRRVYLVGADWHYRPEQTYGFSGCDKEASACGSNNTTMGVLREWMRLLRPEFERVGFRVYNATPGGKLDAFERVSLDDALAEALRDFPVGAATDGLYRGA